MKLEIRWNEPGYGSKKGWIRLEIEGTEVAVLQAHRLLKAHFEEKEEWEQR